MFIINDVESDYSVIWLSLLLHMQLETRQGICRVTQSRVFNSTSCVFLLNEHFLKEADNSQNIFLMP